MTFRFSCGELGASTEAACYTTIFALATRLAFGLVSGPGAIGASCSGSASTTVSVCSVVFALEARFAFAFGLVSGVLLP